MGTALKGKKSLEERIVSFKSSSLCKCAMGATPINMNITHLKIKRSCHYEPYLTVAFNNILIIYKSKVILAITKNW